MQDLPIGEAQANLTRLVNEIASDGAMFTITLNDEPAAILTGVDEYDSLVETLDVLGDTALVAEIPEALASTSTGAVVTHEVVASEVAAQIITRQAAFALHSTS